MSAAQPPPARRDADGSRLSVLDGWRGISILAVLATHLLPLGPKVLRLNETFGPIGMSLFFTLSGFLITRFLLHHASIRDFLIRRVFRVVPLAWPFEAVALTAFGASAGAAIPHLLFYANLPPIVLTDVTGHFWSLCVEMQFYVGAALIAGLLGARGLLLLPILGLAVTAGRAATGTTISIVTWFRLDEVLAGCTLALAWEGRLGPRAAHVLDRVSPWLLGALLFVASHPDSGPFNYLRPYLGATLIGSSLRLPAESRLARLLRGKALGYVAEISYALYVFHPLLAHTWLGSGDKLVKYAKRPLLFAVLFAISHLSTFQYEHRFIALGKRLSARLAAREEPPQVSA